MNSAFGKASRQQGRVPVLLLAVVATLALIFFAFRTNWFGVPLDDHELARALGTEGDAQAVQHGLEQLVARYLRGDQAAAEGQFAAALDGLAVHPLQEVRRVAAWTMGHERSGRHVPVLTRMLKDQDRGTRLNAALALANHSRSEGLPELREALEPLLLLAPAAGVLETRVKVGEALSLGRDFGNITDAAGTVTSVRPSLNGWVRSLKVDSGAQVSAGTLLAEVLPDAATLANVLLALEIVGTEAEVEVLDGLSALGDVTDSAEMKARIARARNAAAKRTVARR